MAKKLNLQCNHHNCEYALKLGDGYTMFCGYILVEKHKRGCECNEDCDKFKVRKRRKKTIDFNAGYVVYNIDPDDEEIENVEVLTSEFESCDA